jgi:hypothetical protein
MYSLSGELTVILITIWWLQKLERLTINKQPAQKFDVERYNLRKLNELEVMKKYQIKISNRFATLEDLRDSEDVDKAWENIKQSIKISNNKIPICRNLSSVNHGFM